MEKQKSALIEALGRKGVSSCRLLMKKEKDLAGDSDGITLEAIDEMWLNLLRFADANDVKVCYCFNIFRN